jgi:integrase
MVNFSTSQFSRTRDLKGLDVKQRTRRHQRGSLLQKNGRWIAKYYYAPGKQTTKTLGDIKGPRRISERQANIMLDELVRPLNLNPAESKRFETVSNFVKAVFYRVKNETGAWRASSEKRARWEIEKRILPFIGDKSIEQVTASDLRAILNHWVADGLGKSSCSHIRSHLTDIFRMARAEGYLQTDIAAGLKIPKIASRPIEKPIIGLDQYLVGWKALDERERLICDLVLFAGLRQSEALGLCCGDVKTDRIVISRSWYLGRWEDPKTANSGRDIGAPPQILERLHQWIESLPLNGPEYPLFQSEVSGRPMSADNLLKRYIYPRLDGAKIPRFNFEILRRSHSTLHKELGTDPRIIAAQQGHGLNTHMKEYVQTTVDLKRLESGKLYEMFEKRKNQG